MFSCFFYLCCSITNFIDPGPPLIYVIHWRVPFSLSCLLFRVSVFLHLVCIHHFIVDRTGHTNTKHTHSISLRTHKAVTYATIVLLSTKAQLYIIFYSIQCLLANIISFRPIGVECPKWVSPSPEHYDDPILVVQCLLIDGSFVPIYMSLPIQLPILHYCHRSWCDARGHRYRIEHEANRRH